LIHQKEERKLNSPALDAVGSFSFGVFTVSLTEAAKSAALEALG
jgi:hypothetical protein